MNVLVGGKEGNGPASYLPSQYQEGNEIKCREDIENNLKYSSVTIT